MEARAELDFFGLTVRVRDSNGGLSSRLGRFVVGFLGGEEGTCLCVFFSPI